MKQLQAKTGKVAIYAVLLAGVLALMFGLKKCSSPNEVLDGRAEGDTLNVAIELSPIGLSTKEDTLSGFHYDLIRLLCLKHKRPVHISAFSNLKSALRQLEAGKFDIVIADIPVTSNMKEHYLYTDSIYIDNQVLVRRKDVESKSFTQNDLAGDTIWIPAGSLAKERIQNLSEEIGDTIYVVEDPKYGAEQLVILTALGDIKQAVVNKKYADALVAEYSNLDISTDISFNQFQSWILSKNNQELCDTINNWLNGFRTTEDFNRLYDNYFGRK